MAMVRRNGNGEYIISKASTVTLGVVFVLITALVGFVSYAAAQNQILTDHVANTHIHMDRAALDQCYMPRGELQAELKAIQTQLDRMEATLWEATH